MKLYQSKILATVGVVLVVIVAQAAVIAGFWKVAALFFTAGIVLMFFGLYNVHQHDLAAMAKWRRKYG